MQELVPAGHTAGRELIEDLQVVDVDDDDDVVVGVGVVDSREDELQVLLLLLVPGLPSLWNGERTINQREVIMSSVGMAEHHVGNLSCDDDDGSGGRNFS